VRRLECQRRLSGERLEEGAPAVAPAAETLVVTEAHASCGCLFVYICSGSYRTVQCSSAAASHADPRDPAGGGHTVTL